MRIIAGTWRGRRIPVLNAEGLRPTKDMVRETLFNWLTPRMAGARCLDMFAGSGALGFEAASRGASHVLMLEQQAILVKHLRTQKDLLNATQIEIQQVDSLQYLASLQQIFDIVFIDPPFTALNMQQVLAVLHSSQCLTAHTLLYIEQSAAQGLPALPSGWHYERQKQSGDVVYGLVAIN
ncbi:MAG: 16S rRNA (guanine(966)-N(2))-methyltransferase RsmD [Gammaproteobacteria bacterium]|nr:16S rRNA (guanine(966)-N(2))-methyltransferase RsmD [Gammaproteobacteria bacterium]